MDAAVLKTALMDNGPQFLTGNIIVIVYNIEQFV
jgi:hypothetical protein